ncbi:hypothetical protein J4227_07735 [Candidatus Woesearchaeota archaeon]|nr:hypothetical protein [Candidatus Woesearchaeota archaeon]
MAGVDDRNIAKQVRFARLGNADGLDKKVEALYPHGKIVVTTKKGQWGINVRDSNPVEYFVEPDKNVVSEKGISALYIDKDGELQGIFIADNDNVDVAKATSGHLSEKILEQRKYFAWPPRSIGEGVSGNTIGMGLAVPTVGGLAYSLFGTEYVQSLSEVAQAFYLIGGVMTTGVALSMGPLILSDPLGRIADRARLKGLPEEARSGTYKYGDDALSSVNLHYGILQNENERFRLEKFFKEAGYTPPRDFTVEFLDAMRSLETGNGKPFAQLARVDPKLGGTVPVHVALNAYDAFKTTQPGNS